MPADSTASLRDRIAAVIGATPLYGDRAPVLLGTSRSGELADAVLGVVQAALAEALQVGWERGHFDCCEMCEDVDDDLLLPSCRNPYGPADGKDPR